MDEPGTALTFWKEYCLDSHRAEWDNQGIEMATYVERSKRSRRDIADNTKAYQRSSAEEKKGKLGPLLKLYQVEIDSLTTRAKYAEAAFLSMYKQLYDAPDPVPLMQRGADSAEKLDKVEKLEQELEEYQEEIKTLKNQDVTVAELEQALAEAKEKVVDQSREAVDQARLDWAEELKNLEAAQLEKEQQLLGKLASMSEALRTEKSQRELREAALFDEKERMEEGHAAQEAQADLVNSELSRAENDSLMLTAENDTLRAQLAILKEQLESVPGPAQLMEVEQTQRKLEQQEETLRLAHTELLHLKTEIDRQKAAFEEVGSELKAKEQKVSELEHTISSLPTKEAHQAMIAQLRTWKIAMVGMLDSEDATPEPQAGQDELSNVLLARNRRLEDDLTRSKLAAQEQSAEFEQALSTCEELKMQLAEVQSKEQQLESQLLSLDSSAAGPAGSPDTKAGVGSEDMVQLLRGQRNCLRTRVDELQAEVNQLEKQRNSASAEAKKLQEDNLELFGKIKYLQSFPVKGGTSIDLEAGSMRDYKKAYDQHENPFSQFRKREKQAQLQSLNIAERTVFSSMSVIAEWKPARTMVFVYALALHMLVFVSLWHAAHGHHTMCCACTTQHKLAILNGGDHHH